MYVLLCAAITPTGPANGTSVETVDLPELVDRAELIVLGTVASVEYGPFETPDGRTETSTFIALNAAWVFKGEVRDRQVALRMLGGIRTNAEGRETRLKIAGAPTFETGGTYLLFVRGNGPSLVPIYGWGQGLFRVAPHPDTGRDILFDERGFVIRGIADNDWLRSGERLAYRSGRPGLPHEDAASSERGDKSAARRNAVRVPGHEGVQPGGANVQEVFDALNAYIARRSTLPTYEPGKLVDPAAPRRDGDH